MEHPSSAGSGAAAGDRSAPEAPPVARELLGDQFEVMDRYVGHLATTAIDYGLIGPRERETLWTRHVLNCAVLSELIESGASLADVGSGAGLPGLVVAIARPDLTVILVEPLLRRSTWLTDVVADLELDNVEVRRARAENVDDLQADVVTSRAVARLDKLVGWSAPLVRPGGRIIAIKGESAAQELADSRDALRKLGISDGRVVQCGQGVVDPPTTVIELDVETPAMGRGTPSRTGRAAKKRGAKNDTVKKRTPKNVTAKNRAAKNDAAMNDAAEDRSANNGSAKNRARENGGR